MSEEIPAIENNDELSHQEDITTDHQHIPNQSLVASSTSHLGNNIALSYDQNGCLKYVLGPQYYIFIGTVLISTSILLYLDYSLASQAPSKNIQFFIGCTTSILLYVYTYCRVGISNPGIASSNTDKLARDQRDHRYCFPCKIVRLPRTKHCYYCDVCIYQYDHHCPWVGKCIGRDNMTYFKNFIFAIIANFCMFGFVLYTISQLERQNNTPPK